MTPAYPEIKPSHVKGVVKAQMTLVNQREDIKYYLVEVFDKNFINIPFSSPYRIMKLDYKERKNFEVFLRKSDLVRAVFICTTSKVLKQRSFGVMGNINNVGGSFGINSQGQSKDIGVYTRIVIPLDKPRSRINCDDLYKVELTQRKLEIQQLRNELEALKDLQKGGMEFEN